MATTAALAASALVVPYLGATSAGAGAPVSCPAPVSAVNGGFEAPVVAANNWTLVPDGSVPGWHSTAPDGLIEIWSNPFYSVTPADGIQLAEIQGNGPDALYQVVATTPGQIIHWSLAHRGREGVDTMQLAVGPDGGPLTIEGTMTDPAGAWVTYTGNYTVPAGQTSTRFSFESVSAAGGSPSVGNLLDAVSLTTDACAIDDTGTTPYGTPLVTAAPGVLGNDAGVGLTSAVTTPPLNGGVVLAPDGSYTYTPSVGFVGTDSFTYTVTAADGSTATATVTITVTMPAAVSSCGSGWQFNGSASLVSACQMLLTPTAPKLAGTAFFPGAQPSSKIASISFDTIMGGGTGADGIGLVFADPTAGAAPTSLGGTGGSLGISGIPASVVTLDTFKNSGGDQSANFVGLCTTAVTTGPVPGLKCNNTAAASMPLRGAALTTRHVVVRTSILNGKPIIRSVTVDGVNVITTGLMQLPPSVLIGFSSATGSSTDTHIVANVVVGYRA